MPKLSYTLNGLTKPLIASHNQETDVKYQIIIDSWNPLKGPLKSIVGFGNCIQR